MKLRPIDNWGLFALGVGGLIVIVIAAWTTYWWRAWPAAEAAEQTLALEGWIGLMFSAIAGIGAIGSLFFLAWNLREARRVTGLAERSARAAEAAVAEAQRNTEENLRMARAQARAYIAATGCSASILWGTSKLTLQYANSGQSPPKLLSINATVRLTGRRVNDTSDVPEVTSFSFVKYRPELPSGATDEYLDDFFTVEELKEVMPDGEWASRIATFTGSFIYRDVFGTYADEAYEDEFGFIFDIGGGQLTTRNLEGERLPKPF